MKEHILAKDFYNLFKGNENYKGFLRTTLPHTREGYCERGIHRGLQIYCSHKSTKKEGGVKVKDWSNHLNGLPDKSLGVPPITLDNSVKFGTIDIDIYKEDSYKKEIRDIINKHNLPLIMCQSKSKGIHLYLFCSELVPSSLMREKMCKIAIFLGTLKEEIFPKQTEILKDKSDVRKYYGEWISVPYYDEANMTEWNVEDKDSIPFKNRWAYNSEGDILTAKEFIAYANKLKITRKELENL